MQKHYHYPRRRVHVNEVICFRLVYLELPLLKNPIENYSQKLWITLWVFHTVLSANVENTGLHTNWTIFDL